jgi:hypothetical protein
LEITITPEVKTSTVLYEHEVIEKLVEEINKKYQEELAPLQAILDKMNSVGIK